MTFWRRAQAVWQRSSGSASVNLELGGDMDRQMSPMGDLMDRRQRKGISSDFISHSCGNHIRLSHADRDQLHFPISAA